MAISSLNATNIQSFITSFDTVLVDCDGVLWKGPEVIPGSVETISLLKQIGKKVFYVTNNSTKTREVYIEKLKTLGFDAKLEEVIGTAYVLANYLKHRVKYEGKVYLVGSTGIAGELDNVGIQHTGLEDVWTPALSERCLQGFDTDPEVKCVAVGMDFHINYLKIAKAQRYLCDPKCLFLASNTDSALPMPGGAMLPGTGSVLAAVETASGRKPGAIMGKPHKPIFEILEDMHQIKASRTIMIGDRLDTDIAFGSNNSLAATILVLTGFNTLEDAERCQQSNSIVQQQQVPDYYVGSLGDFGNLIQSVKDS